MLFLEILRPVLDDELLAWESMSWYCTHSKGFSIGLRGLHSSAQGLKIMAFKAPSIVLQKLKKEMKKIVAVTPTHGDVHSFFLLRVLICSQRILKMQRQVKPGYNLIMFVCVR